MNYLSLLGIFWLLIITLYLREILGLLNQPSYWKSLAGFLTLWVVIENFGLRNGLWSYPEGTISGYFLLGLPVEEYSFFALAHTAAISAYQNFSTER